jgi:predicted nucleotidyltransferase
VVEQSPHAQRCRAVTDRFIAACRADPRVIAATLYGSYARGAADEHSDLDLGLVTTDAAYDAFIAGRDAFIRLLGEPLFVESFGSPDMVFVIFADGVELELMLGREGRFDHGHGGPYEVLLDKANLLAGATFPRSLPSQDEQVETLRRLITWLWHDLSHCITALSRGQLWWAWGQLDELRRTCIKLAVLRHDFAAEVDWDEPYFKIEQTLPNSTA